MYLTKEISLSHKVQFWTQSSPISKEWGSSALLFYFRSLYRETQRNNDTKLVRMKAVVTKYQLNNPCQVFLGIMEKASFKEGCDREYRGYCGYGWPVNRPLGDYPPAPPLLFCPSPAGAQRTPTAAPGLGRMGNPQTQSTRWHGSSEPQPLSAGWAAQHWCQSPRVLAAGPQKSTGNLRWGAGGIAWAGPSQAVWRGTASSCLLYLPPMFVDVYRKSLPCVRGIMGKSRKVLLCQFNK